MAALNLIPNPTVLVVQAGIFLANALIVKKMFVEPYLKVRAQRDAQTIGGKDEATRAIAEAETIQQQVTARLNEAMAVAKKEREALRDVAAGKRDKLLADAEASARAHVDAIEKEIKGVLATERAKVPSVVASLTDEVYKAALS